MGITLGEVLEMEVMKNAKIVTNSFDPATPVENITIMEAPDIGKWIDGSNIILTGLYEIYNNEDKLGELIDSLYLKKICALFIKVNRFVDQIPKKIIKTSEDLGIAVVELNPDIRYIDIMYPVIAAIFDSQVIKLSYFKETLNALSRLALNNKGLDKVASFFSGIIKNPVILYDSNMKCIYATHNEFENALSEEFWEEGITEDMYYTFCHDISSPSGKPFKKLVVPIRIFGQVKVYLSIVELHHPMTEMDFIALENAITVFSFEIMKDFAEEEAERQFRYDLIEDIKRGRNQDTFKDRLSSIHLSPNSKYNVLIIETPAKTMNTPAIVNQQMADNNTIKAYDLYLNLKKTMNLSGFESRKANKVIALIEQPEDTQEQCIQTLEKLSKEYIKKVSASFEDLPVNIGYTSTFQDITHTHELYNNAINALKISTMLYGKNSYCNYDKLGIFKMLCIAREREELINFIPPSVKILTEYQKNNDLDLIQTLECFFQNNCNIQQTAKALFIHYKTLYYRLNKIQSITGVDIKNSNDMLELQMGLIILQLLKDS